MQPPTHGDAAIMPVEERVRLELDSRLLDAEGRPAGNAVVRRLIAVIDQHTDLVPVTTLVDLD